jgi:hypothetical protein
MIRREQSAVFRPPVEPAAAFLKIRGDECYPTRTRKFEVRPLPAHRQRSNKAKIRRAKNPHSVPVVNVEILGQCLIGIVL